MSETQALTLPLGERLALLPWISWGGRHLGEMRNVIDAATEWAAVPFNPLRPKWEVTKSSGDTIVGVLEDAPIFTQALTVEPTIEALQAEELRWDGTLLRLFIENLPAIIAMIERFFPQSLEFDPHVIDAKYRVVVPQALLAGS